MGRKKTIEKEPVTIRFKELANGNKSVYLDIYKDGNRTYEFLKLYIVPEVGRGKAEARRRMLKQWLPQMLSRLREYWTSRTAFRVSYPSIAR